jgi:hypothetical protein
MNRGPTKRTASRIQTDETIQGRKSSQTARQTSPACGGLRLGRPGTVREVCRPRRTTPASDSTATYAIANSLTMRAFLIARRMSVAAWIPESAAPSMKPCDS